VTQFALAFVFGILGFTLLGTYEVIRHALNRKPRKSIYAPVDDQITMLLTGSKRIELAHRDSISMMRDDEDQGGPPLGVDLDSGTVSLPRRPTAEQ
jgi:hypothetical protein